MDKKKFNILLWEFNHKKIEEYDVLPYFRREWDEKPYNWDFDFNEIPVKTWDDLKKWIKDRAHYQFWGRCEYEFLVGSWPFGSRKTTEGVKEFFKKDPNLDNHSDNIDFYNIITDEMVKVDVYDQIKINLDIITDILYEEFFNKKEK